MEIQYHEARIKKSQNIFLLPDIVHAPVMANVISALYDNTRFHILLCPISLFPPMAAVQWPERCVQRRYIVTGGVDRQPGIEHPCMRSCSRRYENSLFPVAAPGFREVLDPFKLEFSGALTRKHVGTSCMRLPFLLHTSGRRVWRTYTRASVHIAER